MKTANRKIIRVIRQVLPYILGLIALIGLLFVGSLNKRHAVFTGINMSRLAEIDYQVSTDQLSEMYMVASLSDSLSFASTETVANNYVIVSMMQDIGQSSVQKITKPSIVDTSDICQGICNHTVTDGETLESIAAKYHLTVDQLRWSNNLKTTAVPVGRQLVVPGVPGIVYTIKNNDTPDSVAAKYGSTAEDLIALNENFAPGVQIIIPNGILPESERPEYVPPVYFYTYRGYAYGRENLQVLGYYRSLPNNEGNRHYAGQCTWYAWWWRKNNPASLGPLPSNAYGNANSWATIYASRGVGRTPRVGAVFQTASGWYGHVGVVVGLHSDGSIDVQEMNLGVPYRVTRGTIPANRVGNFNYIY